MSDAELLIEILQLQPHPEGGFYRETFRDVPNSSGRAHATAIYFLLTSGMDSRWHRIDSVEIWHWYCGSPLELSMSGPGAPSHVVLGNRFEKGERPQFAVASLVWQRARTLGEYSLVGCTVAPGFEFSRFELGEGPADPRS